jgi:hypothetical protein
MHGAAGVACDDQVRDVTPIDLQCIVHTIVHSARQAFDVTLLCHCMAHADWQRTPE